MPGRNGPSASLFAMNTVPHSSGARIVRLSLIFMLLVLATFLSVEGWRAWRDYQQAYASAQDSVINLARATAQHAEDAIRQVDVLTDALRERIEGDGLGNLDRTRIHNLMKQQAQIIPHLHGLFLYDADGRWLVTDKDGVPEGANNADRDYFEYHRTHSDRSVRIGAVVSSRSTHELIIPVSRRLNNPDGSFAGVLLGTIRVSYFVDYYGDFRIDDRGALVLALRDGTILVRRPFSQDVIGTSLTQSEIFKRYLPHSSEGVAEVKAVVDGTTRLYGYRALASYPLVVEAGLSRDSYVGPWCRDLVKTGLVLAVMVACLSGFGLIVLGQIRQRVAIDEQLRLAHQRVREMALTDSLTGLGNRRRLDAELAVQIAHAGRQQAPLALIMLDVDYFKRFNDRYGHAAGDDCLRRVAEAIAGALQKPTDLAVRYGGEEFTVLLPDTDARGAAQVAKAVLAAIRSLNIAHQASPHGRVTASAGIAARQPSSPLGAEGLIKAADTQLYLAKEAGRDNYTGWPYPATDSGFSQ